MPRTPELLRETMWRLVEAIKDATRASRRTIFTLWAVAALFELANRNPLHSDPDRLLAGVGGDTVTWMPVGYSRHLKRAELLALVIEFVTTSVGPLGFLVYAYWTLFSGRGINNIAVWLSLAAALLLVVLAGAFAVIGIRTAKEYTTREQREVTATIRSR